MKDLAYRTLNLSAQPTSHNHPLSPPQILILADILYVQQESTIQASEILIANQANFASLSQNRNSEASKLHESLFQKYNGADYEKNCSDREDY